MAMVEGTVPGDSGLARESLATPAHTTAYLEAGPPDGPLLIFVHGWPAIALTWRHQITHFARLGYRVLAPDMRGYGNSPTAVFDADPASSVKALYRRGNPAVATRPSPTALTTRDGGWFGGAPSAPDLPLDTAVLAPEDHAELTAALARNGFAGPTSYYLNHQVNAAYADAAVNGGRLDLPVLFIGADYDPVADLTNPSMLAAMRQSCAHLTEATVPAGHWVQLEAAQAVNQHLQRWLETRVTHADPAAARA